MVKKATAVPPPPAKDPLASQLNKYKKPRGLKVLVVEDQPIASALFVKEGCTVEKRSHSEMIDTEAQHGNGEIKVLSSLAFVANFIQSSVTQKSSTVFKGVGDVVPNSGAHWHSRVLARCSIDRGWKDYRFDESFRSRCRNA